MRTVIIRAASAFCAPLTAGIALRIRVTRFYRTVAPVHKILIAIMRAAIFLPARIRFSRAANSHVCTHAGFMLAMHFRESRRARYVSFIACLIKSVYVWMLYLATIHDRAIFRNSSHSVARRFTRALGRCVRRGGIASRLRPDR